ncbi:hypothetical protein [Thermocoleostomius sinensis]|uniref:Uncharacterized protein n=1 Tax=Thermocoleostomius sinensis A174 TaxID=2016057 RepID=A0A9E8ZAK5_9CYAN|nr:hypothetical protein [Thermocoleostomius sinensis]WAL59635.1 hypothetical protein OXH18_21065 [Thermocoleostomius sinensis A174]
MILIDSKNILRIVTIGIAQVLLCIGLLSPLRVTTELSPGTPIVATYESSAQVPDPNSIDVDRASAKADEASEQIFEGLDTTKRIIGKTDKRNQVIQKARETASHKLKDLSERADQTPDAESLTPPDKQVLDQIQN